MNGLYQISNLGRVKSLNYMNTGKEKLKKPTLQKKYIMKQGGYYQIQLHKNNNAKNFVVHRLVAQAFLPNPDNLPQVNHKDHNKTNNCVDNLEWCTAKYNSNHKRNSRKPLGE